MEDASSDEIKLTQNEEKREAFAKQFFPQPPGNPGVDIDQEYPDPVCEYQPITREQIKHVLQDMSPHKAPGLDGIPNMVYQKLIDIAIDTLYSIFEAIIQLKWYPQEWQDYLTIVLRKQEMNQWQ